jgi:hypothetical protein
MCPDAVDSGDLLPEITRNRRKPIELRMGRQSRSADRNRIVMKSLFDALYTLFAFLE